MTKLSTDVNSAPPPRRSRRRRSTMNAPAQARQVHRASLSVRTRQLAWIINRVYDEQLKPLALDAVRFDLLALVISRGRVSPKEIAGQPHLYGAPLDGAIDAMVEAGWLVYEEDEAGGRAPSLTCTPEGAALFEQALPAWKRAQAAAAELLGTEGTHAMTVYGDAQAMW